jgi:AbrB family looped-hinge helix DNA binding protein
VTLQETTMATTLTSKGQVTIPKHIRDALHLQPGTAVEFSVNAGGEVVLHPARPTRTGSPRKDRFDAVRGRAACAGAPMS